MVNGTSKCPDYDPNYSPPFNHNQSLDLLDDLENIFEDDNLFNNEHDNMSNKTATQRRNRKILVNQCVAPVIIIKKVSSRKKAVKPNLAHSVNTRKKNLKNNKAKVSNNKKKNNLSSSNITHELPPPPSSSNITNQSTPLPPPPSSSSNIEYTINPYYNKLNLHQRKKLVTNYTQYMGPNINHGYSIFDNKKLNHSFKILKKIRTVDPFHVTLPDGNLYFPNITVNFSSIICLATVIKIISTADGNVFSVKGRNLFVSHLVSLLILNLSLNL